MEDQGWRTGIRWRTQSGGPRRRLSVADQGADLEWETIDKNQKACLYPVLGWHAFDWKEILLKFEFNTQRIKSKMIIEQRIEVIVIIDSVNAYKYFLVTEFVTFEIVYLISWLRRRLLITLEDCLIKLICLSLWCCNDCVCIICFFCVGHSLLCPVIMFFH